MLAISTGILNTAKHLWFFMNDGDLLLHSFFKAINEYFQGPLFFQPAFQSYRSFHHLFSRMMPLSLAIFSIFAINSKHFNDFFLAFGKPRSNRLS